MNHLEAFRYVHTLLFDVDGVFTNSELLVLESGQLLRSMSVRDGLAIKLAIRAGLRVAIITGGASQGVVSRMRALGIKDVFSGVEDKLATYEAYRNRHQLESHDHILYMGDDLPDYPVMRRVGLPTCPADAVPEIRRIAQYVSPFVGGSGCVRDVIEKVLKLQGRWPQFAETELWTAADD